MNQALITILYFHIIATKTLESDCLVKLFSHLAGLFNSYVYDCPDGQAAKAK